MTEIRDQFNNLADRVELDVDGVRRRALATDRRRRRRRTLGLGLGVCSVAVVGIVGSLGYWSSDAGSPFDPAESSNDSGLIRTEEQFETYPSALAVGTLELSSNCLVLSGADGPDSHVLVFPPDTTWVDEGSSIRLPYGDEFQVGEHVKFGGGFLEISAAEEILGRSVATAIQECTTDGGASRFILVAPH